MAEDAAELDDYESLLDPSFNPISFANDLLLATNSNHNELDLFTSIKRINFDISNIDLQIDNISSENHESIIKEVHKGEATKKLYNQLAPSLDQINVSYQRLEKDILTPYKEAIKVQDALKKIHSTSYLLRGVTYFLFLIQQIEEIQSAKDKESSLVLLKLANLHNQLKIHLAENPNLKSLKIIRDYEPIGSAKQRDLIDSIQSILRSINERTIGNYSDDDIENYFQVLYTIDKSKLYQYMGSFLNNYVIISVNTLLKVLNSPRNIELALEDISKKGQFISKISKILSLVKINDKMSLLQIILEKLELVSLLSTFWRDVAKNFEVKFRETIQRGGPVAKALISYKEQIRTFIKSSVVKSDPSTINPEGIEVRMMLNAVSTLDRAK